jgi:hypothetical protein
VLETARTMKIQRVQQDLEKIAKREREYARKLIEEIVPVKIMWNEDAWQRLQGILPIRVVDRTMPERPATPTPSPSPTVVEADSIEPPIA